MHGDYLVHLGSHIDCRTAWRQHHDHIDHGTSEVHFALGVPFVSCGVNDPSILFLKVDREVKIELKLNGSITK